MKSRFRALLYAIIATAVLLAPVSPYADEPSVEKASLNATPATEASAPKTAPIATEASMPKTAPIATNASAPKTAPHPVSKPGEDPAVSSKPSAVTPESSIESAIENNGIVPGELIVGVPLMPVEDFLRLVPESIGIEHVYDIVAATVAPEIPSPEQFKYSIFHISLKDKSNEHTAKAFEAFKSIDIVVEAGYNGLAYPAEGAGDATAETPKDTTKITVFEQRIEGVDFDNNHFLNQSDLNTYMCAYYQLRVGDSGWDDSPGSGLPPGREVDLDFNGVIDVTDIVVLYAYI